MLDPDKIICDIDSSITPRKSFQKAYPNFIYKIRFPVYKNLAPNAELEFKYPLTVLTGQNGCGKSSILHALQGAPTNRSVGNLWFSTKLDPIQEGKGKPNCIIFEYFNTKASKKVEVIKQRVQFNKKKGLNRRVNPDYWEPTRASKEYKMVSPLVSGGKAEPGGLASGRWEVPKINVQYIDFRAELSASDQYLYFGEKPYGSKRYKSKQDKLRSWVKNSLSVLFEGTKTTAFRRNKKLNASPVKILPPEELETISYIIGKQYVSCKMVEHSCFEMVGTSVQFKTQGLRYTEVFAGSGEMAVARLVHLVMNAEKNSLILLDEPEVSLHPGAQKKLRNFLLDQCLKSGHQVVISSHSPAFVEGLPDKAVRVLTPGIDEKYQISGDVSMNDAFVQIGHTIDSKFQIIVEDSAACLLVEKALFVLGEEYAHLFQVSFYPGGETSIFKDLVVHARTNNERIFVIFDGDINRGSWPEIEKVADVDIDTVIETLSGQSIDSLNFRFDGGNDPAKRDKHRKIKRDFIAYIASHCFYLPTDTPEELIWQASGVANKHAYENGIQATDKDRFKMYIGRYAQEQVSQDSSQARNFLIRQIMNKSFETSDATFVRLLETLRKIKLLADSRKGANVAKRTTLF